MGVYIAEAHAADEWPVGSRVSICKQTRSVEERVALAKAFVAAADLAFPMMVDTMANEFMDTFAAWPFRVYIIQGTKVAYRAMPEKAEAGYNVGHVEEWLACNT